MMNKNKMNIKKLSYLFILINNETKWNEYKTTKLVVYIMREGFDCPQKLLWGGFLTAPKSFYEGGSTHF